MPAIVGIWLSERERAIMRNPPAPRVGRRHARALLWTERLLLAAGAAMLLWCAVLVGDAAIAQRTARSLLDATALAERSAAPLARPGPPDTRRRSPALHAGSPMASLSIPRLRLTAVVLEGSDAQTLRRGPGHLENTALPGAAGNAVIAGHRDSFFLPLRHVQRGDDIFVDTPNGLFRYRVTSFRVVRPRDLSVLAPTDTPVLTLITCYPFWVFGNAPDRFVVRAVAVVDVDAPRRAPDEPGRGVSVTLPPPDGSIADAAVAPVTPAVRADRDLVREAIERFRLAYNARAISHRDAGPGGPLSFQSCEIAVDGDQATAVCAAAAAADAPSEAHTRTFALERVVDGWAILSIAVT
jgi:sortase A